MPGVPRSRPVTKLGGVIDWVKARTAKSVNYASGGTGTSTHLVAELFFRRAGLQLNHVPYKGGAPALQDLLAGHVSAYLRYPAEFLPPLVRLPAPYLIHTLPLPSCRPTGSV